MNLEAAGCDRTVVGYLAVGAGGREVGIFGAFRQGLSEAGYVDG